MFSFFFMPTKGNVNTFTSEFIIPEWLLLVVFDRLVHTLFLLRNMEVLLLHYLVQASQYGPVVNTLHL